MFHWNNDFFYPGLTAVNASYPEFFVLGPYTGPVCGPFTTMLRHADCRGAAYLANGNPCCEKDSPALSHVRVTLDGFSGTCAGANGVYDLEITDPTLGLQTTQVLAFPDPEDPGYQTGPWTINVRFLVSFTTVSPIRLCIRTVSVTFLRPIPWWPFNLNCYMEWQRDFMLNDCAGVDMVLERNLAHPNFYCYDFSASWGDPKLLSPDTVTARGIPA